MRPMQAGGPFVDLVGEGVRVRVLA